MKLESNPLRYHRYIQRAQTLKPEILRKNGITHVILMSVMDLVPYDAGANEE